MKPAIDALLRHPAIWRADRCSSMTCTGLPTSFSALDEALGGYGWPLGALTELLSEHEGVGEILFLLKALSLVREKTILWVAPPYVPYAPALQNAGIDIAQCLIAYPKSSRDALWTTEQSAKSGACAAIVAWLETNKTPLAFSQLQRLHMAAVSGNTTLFLFRAPTVAPIASPAPIRIRIGSHDNHVVLTIFKRRGPPLTSSMHFLIRGKDWPQPRNASIQKNQSAPATTSKTYLYEYFHQVIKV